MNTTSLSATLALVGVLALSGCAQEYYSATGPRGTECLLDCKKARGQCRDGGNDRREHECWRAEVNCFNTCPDVRFEGKYKADPVGSN